MHYTPNDLQNIALGKTIYGYKEDSVNDLIDRIIEDYSSYISENIALKEKITSLNEALQSYRSIEDALRNSLVVAQGAGEEVKRNSYQKADNIVKEAEMKAQKIIDEATEYASNIKREVEDLRNNMKLYRTKCESIIYSQLEMLKQYTED